MASSVTRYLVVSKLQECGHGVCPRRQHEDEGGAAVAVRKRLGQVEGGRLNERAPQFVGYVLLQHGNDLQRDESACERELPSP